MKQLRLLPIVIVAGTALTGLKFLGLVFDGGYLLTPIPIAAASQQEAPASAETDKSGTPAGDSALPAGDLMESKPQPSAANAEVADAAPAELSSDDDKPVRYGTRIVPGGGSDAKRAILERLGERRKVLESREKEIELREQLLKAAEQRLEQRVAKLKVLEERIGGAVTEKKKQQKDKFNDLVKMYESMKPKAAAKIFDRLELAVLLPVAKQMNPRKLGDVMARMTPEAAEKLTVALATDSFSGAEKPMRQLPKIEGKKTIQ